MDTKTKTISILIFYLCTFFSYSATEKVCPRFSCGSLPSGDCSLRKKDETTQFSSFTLQTCPSNNQQCPFYNLDDPERDTLKCEEKDSVLIRLYPGGPCESETDCLEGQCNDGVCAGIAEKEKCSKNSECYYGFACRKGDTPEDNTKYCLPQRKEGEACVEDEECLNSHGCFNGKCIPYFSLADGTLLESQNSPILCQSGYKHDDLCARLTLVNGKDACDKSRPCTYDNNGKTITIEDNCQCGYNPSGKTFCKIGSGDKEYLKFIQDFKNLLSDTTSCNTLERTGICNHNKKLGNKHLIFLNGNFTNSKVLAENAHELVEADECVIKVAFPEYIPEPEPPVPPVPETKTCAKYTCKRGQKSCAHSHWDLATNTTNVVLSNICDSKSYCDIGGDPNQVFYKNEDVDGKCSLKQHIAHALRYPGEDCKVDTDCFSPDKDKYPDEKLVGTCKNGKCQGYSKNQLCEETSWCNVGYHCSETEKKCVSQLSENADCTKTNQCQNNLICFEGKCKNKWYSQPAGTDVTGKTDVPYEYLCAFGKVSGGKCNYFNNTDTVDPKTELVQCNVGDDCHYDTVDGPKTKKCECGFNENGYSYCQKGHNHGKNVLK
jgi:hypothetical protein